MRTTIASKLVVFALTCFAVGCDESQPTSPASWGETALQAEASLSAAHHPKAANTTIVLVHGAFAGALAWQDVIALLQREGYNVIAVENPLLSADQDVETTRRDQGRDRRRA